MVEFLCNYNQFRAFVKQEKLMPLKLPGSSKLYAEGIPLQQGVLSSGLRVIHQEITSTRAVHCGLIIDCGSRDERPGETGMAHFLEHMIFKGTEKRKTYQILNAVESAGGELNAYTTKEKTCVYASLEAGEIDRAMDVISDMVFHPQFSEREIVKEKQVIAEEIDMYRDNPEEAIFEDFDTLVFPEDNLGKPILGTKKSIHYFSPEKLRAFHKRNYTINKMLLSVSGNIKMENLMQKAQKHFGNLNTAKGSARKFKKIARGNKLEKTEYAGSQTHCIIGGKSYPIHKGKFVAFHLLNNYLGGAAGNSKLNMMVRENKGLSYSIFTFYQPFLDTGIWGVYFAGEPKNAAKIQQIIHQELKELRMKNPGTALINRIKKQANGQLVLGNENPQTLMLGAGKSMLDFNKNYSLEQMLKMVDNVSDRDFREAADFAFNPDHLQTLIYTPKT